MRRSGAVLPGDPAASGDFLRRWWTLAKRCKSFVAVGTLEQRTTALLIADKRRMLSAGNGCRAQPQVTQWPNFGRREAPWGARARR